MAEITPEGYVARTQAEVLEDILAKWQSKPALSGLSRAPEEPQMQLAEVFAEFIADVEQGVELINAARSRATAVGQQADDIGNLVGVRRREATKSTVLALMTLDPFTTVFAGTRVASAIDEDSVYELIADALNPTGIQLSIEFEMQAVTAGSSTFVAAGDLTDIVTPAVGLVSVTNNADSVAGTDRESTPDYKLRQENSLSVAGGGTADAMRSALNTIDGVTALDVLENDTTMTDLNGVGPKSFEVVIEGGDTDDIAQAIWDNKPLGISDQGTESDTIVDAAGVAQEVFFSRPTTVPIHVEYTLTTDADYPGDAAFAAALVQAADAFFGLGSDVIRARLIDLAFQIAGVVDVVDVLLGTVSASGTANIAIADRERPDFDTTRVTVT
jgi:uncharacterized phage protein gp47/JayE